MEEILCYLITVIRTCARWSRNGILLLDEANLKGWDFFWDLVRLKWRRTMLSNGSYYAIEFLCIWSRSGGNEKRRRVINKWRVDSNIAISHQLIGAAMAGCVNADTLMASLVAIVDELTRPIIRFCFPFSPLELTRVKRISILLQNPNILSYKLYIRVTAAFHKSWKASTKIFQSRYLHYPL